MRKYTKPARTWKHLVLKAALYKLGRGRAVGSSLTYKMEGNESVNLQLKFPIGKYKHIEILADVDGNFEVIGLLRDEPTSKLLTRNVQ